jgi:hypothetical protein
MQTMRANYPTLLGIALLLVNSACNRSAQPDASAPPAPDESKALVGQWRNMDGTWFYGRSFLVIFSIYSILTAITLRRFTGSHNRPQSPRSAAFTPPQAPHRMAREWFLLRFTMDIEAA